MITFCGAGGSADEGGVAMNREANLLPASEAILLPADTTSLDAKSPTVLPVIRLTILAICIKYSTSTDNMSTNVSCLLYNHFIWSSLIFYNLSH
jgi:hypothetical protein